MTVQSSCEILDRKPVNPNPQDSVSFTLRGALNLISSTPLVALGRVRFPGVLRCATDENSAPRFGSRGAESEVWVLGFRVFGRAGVGFRAFRICGVGLRIERRKPDMQHLCLLQTRVVEADVFTIAIMTVGFRSVATDKVLVKRDEAHL